MKLNDAFPSKFLKAEDLDGDLTVTIQRVDLETLTNKDKKDESKPVAYFREKTVKPLVLNKTNFSIIAKLHGDDSDDWTGKPITLFVMDVDSFGDVVSAIRVRAAKAVAAPNGSPDKPLSDQVRWTAFCKERGYNAAKIYEALGTQSVSAWMKEHGQTLENAMAALDEHFHHASEEAPF